ncbi:MAG: hypothetical protein D6797_05725, partial [Bdellovibrio sp.]
KVPCEGNGICEPGEFPNSTDCPECKDENECTIDDFDFNLSNCSFIPIINCDGNGICEPGEFPNSTDCPSCDDNYTCTNDYYDFFNMSCVNEPFFPCCGNNICESEENYSECSVDCVASTEDLLRECGSDDNCKIGVAKEQNDLGVCNKLLLQENVWECQKAVAIQNRNVGICLFIEDNDVRESCVIEVAALSLNYDMCKQNLEFPNHCIEEIALRAKNKEICDQMIEESVYNERPAWVKKCVAKVTKDYSLCRTIEFNWIKNFCFQEIAIMLGDDTICEGKTTNVDYCKELVASRLK